MNVILKNLTDIFANQDVFLMEKLMYGASITSTSALHDGKDEQCRVEHKHKKENL